MYEPQQLLDLQDNNGGFGGGADSRSWLSGEDRSPTLRRTDSSLSNSAAGNVDRMLFNDLVEIVPLVQSLIDRKAKSSFTRRGSMTYTKTPSKATAAEDDDDDDAETEEEKKAAEDRAAALKASGKKKESGKLSVILDVKPWDDVTDMKKLEEAVRTVQMEGLFWGVSKLVPIGYGVKKLKILTIVDDLESVSDLILNYLTVEPINEYVQSCDIVDII